MKKMLIPVLTVLAADAAAKVLAVNCLGSGTVDLGGFLQLRLAENTGLGLGIFTGVPWLSLLLPPLVILLGALVLRSIRPDGFTQVCCGCILGGFLGNYGERLISGHVTDMLYFPWLPWFICNAADIAICAGAALLALHLLFGKKAAV